MSSRLLPCPACNRHVRTADGGCPFCGAATGFAAAAALPTPPTAMSRAARLAAGAVVAGMVAVTGCGDDGSPPADSGTATDTGAGDSGTPDAGADTGAPDSAIAPPYGAPPDSGADDAGTDTGTPDAGVAPPYGAPPEDGG